MCGYAWISPLRSLTLTSVEMMGDKTNKIINKR